MTIGNPAGIAAAIEELAVTDQVHCVPGFRHHVPTRFRRADGCRRRVVRGPVIVVPPAFVVPRVRVVPRARWCHRWRTSRRFAC